MKIPSHVAIIMDGNGRWALEKGLPRNKGHLAGVKTFEKILKKTVVMDIKCLTVYTFSTENWKRPVSEVNFLMNLFQETLVKHANDLFKNDVRVKVIGRRDKLTSTLIDAINRVEEKTKENKVCQLNIAFNYGSRAEIIDVFTKIIDEYNKGNKVKKIDEKLINNYLYDTNFPDVELLIRTGGEKRLSNFLLWQSAYTELYFSERYWPDFDEKEFEKAIKIFQKRNRRYGGLTEAGEK